MNIESKVEYLFYKEGIQVSCTTRPWYNNPLGVNKDFYGIEVHKKDVGFVSNLLSRLGVEYNILEGRFLNVKGSWTHKSFNFIELPNHKEAYHTIIEGGGFHEHLA